VVGVLTLRGGGDTSTEGSSSGSSSGSSPTSPTPAPPTNTKATCAAKPDVTVHSADDLTQALGDAKPGQSIRVADGSYAGEFEIKASGTAKQPIELCGSRKAVLEGGPADGGYTLHLDGASYWRVIGISLHGGQKGLMADQAVGDVIDGISVSHTGDEAIHLRNGSTDNIVANSTVRDTGLRKAQYGEGIYVGTAQSNWCDVSGCKPDRSDRNTIRDNDVAGTTAENVDIKEGTSHGKLLDNTFSGAGMTEGDSWVDVKGNSWLIAGNRGSAAPEDGIQVHQILDGWGRDNVFRANQLQVDAKGYGINVTKRHDDNVVACSNKASGAAAGLTTIDCTS
jgi:hypothetical protein